jgi:anhydro-N-acetylmuramic acid kinase
MSESARRRIFIGIMSGTSLDGIDVVAVRFSDHVEVVGSHSSPFPEGLSEILYELATAEAVNMDLLVRTNFALSEAYAVSVRSLLTHLDLAPKTITAIGLHGQTVRHLPRPTQVVSDLAPVRATLQLGSGPALAALTGIDVVHDFRSADMAAGGEGAPFIPMFDAAFFSSPDVDRITLNIGGIANLTWLPKSQINKEIIAFDTGPGNMLIDALMKEYFDRPFDSSGEVARSGSVDEVLLEELLRHPYFSTPPPKSTGRELFGSIFLKRFQETIETGKLLATDAITTATLLTARSIARAKKWLPTSKQFELIASGGGALNTFLLDSLAHSLSCVATTSASLGIPVQEKEAIAFAYFAKAFLDDELIHLPATTGAAKRVMLGSLSKGSPRASR